MIVKYSLILMIIDDMDWLWLWLCLLKYMRKREN